jgi:KaiC/GvpD/RAD55 family RecA-like ATPase
LPRIPLIEDLTSGPIPAGSNLLVEFDPASQWYNASITIAAGWLRTAGTLNFLLTARPPDKIRAQLNRLGTDAKDFEKNDKLRIWDAYSATLGVKSQEKYAFDTLKVADLSIRVSKEFMRGPPSPDLLWVLENSSVLARFNDEKAWVEYTLSRRFPTVSLTKSTAIFGLIRGVHSDWAYKQLETAADGIVDFKLEEEGGKTKDLMRIRSMRNVHFDREWHELKVGENFEVTLDKKTF